MSHAVVIEAEARLAACERATAAAYAACRTAERAYYAAPRFSLAKGRAADALDAARETASVAFEREQAARGELCEVRNDPAYAA